MAQANLKAVITAEDRASKTIGSVGSSFGKLTAAMAVGQLAANAVSGAIRLVTDAIKNNVGAAVKRVDTLKNANRTFENMGFTSKQAGKSMKNLEKSILGLPTPLDEAVRGMTSLAATYGDLDTGQKVFTALNDAILGFGGTADMASNAVMQLSQLPMDGPLDAQTWMSLRNSGLTPVLVAMAKDMGISVDVMKEKFGEGELTVKDFTDALVKMDKDGGGGMKSLKKIAKDATKGIGTGVENMKTAIVRGIGKVIEAIGSENISDAISKIGKTFENVLKKLANVIPKIIEYIKNLTKKLDFRKTLDYIKDNAIKFGKALKDAFDFLKPSLEALWKTFTEQLFPALKRLWHELIEPLIPIIGGVLVGAIWLLVNYINLWWKALGFVIQVGLNLKKFFVETLPKALLGAFDFMVKKFLYVKDNFWEIIGRILGFFATLPIKMPYFMVLAFAKIVSFILSFKWSKIFSGIWRAMQGVWDKITDIVVRAWHYIHDLKWSDLLKGVAKGIGNAIMGLIEGAINGAISGIPGVGDVHLPRFAQGVRDFGGGQALVGENGPERVYLPKGSTVMPNSMSGGGSSVNITVQAGAFMGNKQDARKYAQMIFESLKDVAQSNGMTIGQMIG